MYNTKKQLTKEQIMSIPKKRESMTDSQIAEEFDCSRVTIQRWIKRLRALGIEVQKGRMGRPKTL